MSFACPECGAMTGVTDSRPSRFGIRRRRACPRCKKRFTTHEFIAGSIRANDQVDLVLRRAAQQLVTTTNELLAVIRSKE